MGRKWRNNSNIVAEEEIILHPQGIKSRRSSRLRPHVELNAGLIVIFSSSRLLLFDWNAQKFPGSITEDEFKEETSNLVFAFRDIVAWVRAAFKQEVLSSLLMMSDIAPVFNLPGDRMLQVTEITQSRQRPAIMHAYGGAKVEMERSLASIAAEGWISMAAALLGTAEKRSMWASVSLRSVASTTIDFRVLPPSLSERENCLCSRTGNSGMPLESPTLLCPNDLLELMWILDRMMQLLYLLEAELRCPRDSWSSPSCPPAYLGRQPFSYSKVISQLALRIITRSILAIYHLSATEYLPAKFPYDQWNEAVRWHGDTKLIATIQNEAKWADAKIILA